MKACFKHRTLKKKQGYFAEYVQGGAVNRGLFFAHLPPPPLAAVSGKISNLSYSVNIVAGAGGPANAVEMACRRHTTQSSAQNGNI
jgi:hypothetical protein